MNDKKKFKHKPSSYLEAFLNLRCNTDLQLLEVFPNIKEITESMAMATACWKLGIDRKRDDVVVVCVGDGTTPRTAALLAHTTKWTTLSVDPKLNYDRKYEAVKRLTLLPVQIEQATTLQAHINHMNVVIVGCHSHASLATSVERIARYLPETIGVVSMECCKADDLSVIPDITYYDKAVWSPKCKVNIWKPRIANFWRTANVVALGSEA